MRKNAGSHTIKNYNTSKTRPEGRANSAIRNLVLSSEARFEKRKRSMKNGRPLSAVVSFSAVGQLPNNVETEMSTSTLSRATNQERFNQSARKKQRWFKLANAYNLKKNNPSTNKQLVQIKS